MNKADSPIARLLAMQKKAQDEGRNYQLCYDATKGVSAWVGRQPKKRQGRCNALCRTGEPCKMRVVPGKRRCRLHGGLSTGPKTPQGRQRIADANRQRAEARKASRERNIARGRLIADELERRGREGLPLLPLPPIEELEAAQLCRNAANPKA